MCQRESCQVASVVIYSGAYQTRPNIFWRRRSPPRVWFWSFKLILAVFHLVFKCSTAICRYCSWLTFMVDCSNSKFLFLAPCLLCLLRFLGDTLHLLFSFKTEKIYIYLLTFFPQQKCHLSYTSLTKIKCHIVEIVSGLYR